MKLENKRTKRQSVRLNELAHFVAQEELSLSTSKTAKSYYVLPSDFGNQSPSTSSDTSHRLLEHGVEPEYEECENETEPEEPKTKVKKENHADNARTSTIIDIVYKIEPPDEYKPSPFCFSGYGTPNSSMKLEPSLSQFNGEAENNVEQEYTCLLQISKKCAGTDIDVTRFTELNKHEFYCKTCQFQICNGGHETVADYIAWKEEFSLHSKKVPCAKLYVQDRLLPFWLRCRQCHKFREVPINGLIRNPLAPEDIASFICGSFTNTNACNDEMNPSVIEAWSMKWMLESKTPPLLINSPATLFIDRLNQFYDVIGMSPSQSKFTADTNRIEDWAKVFYEPYTDPLALAFRAADMEYDEKEKFPAFKKEPLYYVALRNLIVSLWTINPFEYLTYEKCEQHLICHGLSRVWYCRLLRPVYDFLNVHGIINIGVVDLPKAPETRLNRRLSVAIIGAGLSGLTAARQLRSFGAEVTIFEAKSIVGGRMQDCQTLGPIVGKGAQIVTGTSNSPIILICKQKGFRYRSLGTDCPVLDSELSKPIDAKSDELALQLYDSALDGNSQWRSLRKRDRSLLEMMESQKDFIEDALDLDISELERRIFYWHIANTEYACGAPLDRVSATFWDQNESLGQFDGKHSLLLDGAQRVIGALSEGTDIRLNTKVTQVKLNNTGVSVHFDDGESQQFHKVLVTVPLAVLKKNVINFIPSLPKRKTDAIERIGAGRIEKLAVAFPRCFWGHLKKQNGSLDFFANVSSVEQRGLFHTIYDFTDKSVPNPSEFVLMTYVCGESLKIIDDLSDAEVVKMFVSTLKKMFPGKVVPKPVSYMVSRWGKDEHIGMSYSYMGVGAKPEDYDSLAAPVQNRIYFAGEATHRFFPQTMHGAYLSGLRATTWMLDDYIVDHSKEFVL